MKTVTELLSFREKKEGKKAKEIYASLSDHIGLEMLQNGKVIK